MTPRGVLLAPIIRMTITLRSRLLAGTAALALGTLAACGDSNRQHAVDADTGAAAPATTRDMSATPNAPDSTAGVAAPTGSAAPAGTTDTTRKAMPAPAPKP